MRCHRLDGRDTSACLKPWSLANYIYFGRRAWAGEYTFTADKIELHEGSRSKRFFSVGGRSERRGHRTAFGLAMPRRQESAAGFVLRARVAANPELGGLNRFYRMNPWRRRPAWRRKPHCHGGDKNCRDCLATQSGNTIRTPRSKKSTSSVPATSLSPPPSHRSKASRGCLLSLATPRPEQRRV